MSVIEGELEAEWQKWLAIHTIENRTLKEMWMFGYLTRDEQRDD